ncbi:hypothetical protein CVV38_04355 [Candidatus Peregrinibacteria bacterium HGW-Peregrinibacteria-1]|jgi:hypothetical protein|nr:MAG: hypothetical protein CVV38_04355 [Candidatus Peregrinibacteria bacterium HGW-Peregrinibacteria-1]
MTTVLNQFAEEYENLLGAEARQDIQILDESDALLASLDQKNRTLFDETHIRYQGLESRISAKLREGVLPQEKDALLRLKKSFAEMKAKFLRHFAEFVSADIVKAEEANLAKNAEELFGKLDQASEIPTDEAEAFKAYWRRLPQRERLSYLNLLKSAFSKRDKDPVAVLTSFRGALFELSRREILERQGLEEIEEFDDPIVVEYLGYDKKADAGGTFDKPPYKHLGGDEKGDIQIDVGGISRGGKPYVYETKSATRKRYGGEHGRGESVSSRNQALKYQRAIEEGKVAGATIELTGRIDSDFLKWAMGSDVASKGAVPDVEIIYSLLLPSGKEYRFVLKGGANGLKFANESDDFTVEDRSVIAGLSEAVKDKSIIHLLQDGNISTDIEHPLVTAEHIADPSVIRDINIYNAYYEMRNRSIWEKLQNRADQE